MDTLGLIVAMVVTVAKSIFGGARLMALLQSYCASGVKRLRTVEGGYGTAVHL